MYSAFYFSGMHKYQLYYTVYSKCAKTRQFFIDKMSCLNTYSYIRRSLPDCHPEKILIFIDWDQVSPQTIFHSSKHDYFTVVFSFKNQTPIFTQTSFSLIFSSKESINIHMCREAHKAYLQQQKKFLKLTSGNDYKFILLKNIAFLKADNIYTKIYLTDNRCIQAFSTLKSFQKRLPNNFVRVHKSFIINTAKVYRINFQKRQVYFHKQQTPALFSKKHRATIELLEKNYNLYSY